MDFSGNLKEIAWICVRTCRENSLGGGQHRLAYPEEQGGAGRWLTMSQWVVLR